EVGSSEGAVVAADGAALVVEGVGGVVGYAGCDAAEGADVVAAVHGGGGVDGDLAVLCVEGQVGVVAVLEEGEAVFDVARVVHFTLTAVADVGEPAGAPALGGTGGALGIGEADVLVGAVLAAVIFDDLALGDGKLP